jgi:hypothetical protein
MNKTVTNKEFGLSTEEVQPLAGWACIAVGVGFIATLAFLLVAVRFLAL